MTQKLCQNKKNQTVSSKMMISQQSFVLSILFLFCWSTHFRFSSSEPVSIYEVLRSHGLPMGLLPKGVKNFTLGDAGRFEVHLDQACIAKFENELQYDPNISGTLTYGQIGGLSGIAAQDLFLWFPVKEIRVDIPSSGLIYFDVGVVSKQFSLSTFETPRDCTAVQGADLKDGFYTAEILSMSPSRELRYRVGQQYNARAGL